MNYPSQKSWLYPLLMISAGSLAVYSAHAETIKVSSPDNAISVNVSDDDGVVRYAVNYKGKEVITPSRLGLAFNDKADFLQSLKISSHARSSHDETWEQPWGEDKTIRDHHNQLSFTLEDENGQPFAASLTLRR